MKGRIKAVTAVVFALIFSSFLTVGIQAEDYIEKYKKYLTDGEGGRKITVTEFLTGEEKTGDGVYESEIEVFFSTLSPELKEELGTADGLYTSSDKYGLSFFTGLIVSRLKEALSGAALPAAVLVALIAAAFFARSLSHETAFGDTVSFALNAAVCVYAASSGILSFSSLSKYFTTLSSLAAAAVPACAALLAASGRVAASSVSALHVSVVSAISENVFSGICLPMIASSCALTFAESLFVSDVKLSVSKFLRSAAVWIAVAVTTVSSFIFGLQSALSNASDTVGLKTLKFALGSAVPLVGGALGDTVSAISAGASSVKGFFGVTLLAALFISVLTPLIPLILGKLSVCVAKAVSGVLGGTGERLFSEISSLLNAMIALVVTAAASFGVVSVAFISYGAVI